MSDTERLVRIPAHALTWPDEMLARAVRRFYALAGEETAMEHHIATQYGKAMRAIDDRIASK
jgi:hypothetical protein